MAEQDFIKAGYTVVGSEDNENKLLNFLKEHFPSVIKGNEITKSKIESDAEDNPPPGLSICVLIWYKNEAEINPFKVLLKGLISSIGVAKLGLLKVPISRNIPVILFVIFFWIDIKSFFFFWVTLSAINNIAEGK